MSGPSKKSSLSSDKAENVLVYVERLRQRTRQRPDVKADDLILFGKYSGQESKLDGVDYIIMREDEILGVIEGADAKKKK